MGQPYIGEIRMFGGNFAPAGWMFCQGQTLPISENDALFTLIGTTYGGDGQETFQLPDLQGRLPMHAGQGPGLSQNYQLGDPNIVNLILAIFEPIAVLVVIAYWIWRTQFVHRLLFIFFILQLLIGAGFVAFFLLFFATWKPKMM